MRGRNDTVTIASDVPAVPVRPRVVETALKVAFEMCGDASTNIVTTCREGARDIKQRKRERDRTRVVAKKMKREIGRGWWRQR
jgi:hypothetical protein